MPKGTPGARKVCEKSAKWYGRAPGSPRPVPLCENKSAAQTMLNEMARKAGLAAVGLGDPYEKHRNRPLAEHLTEFAAALQAKGDSDKHVELTLTRLHAALNGMGAVLLADLDAGAAGDWLTSLRADRQAAVLPPEQTLFRLAEVAALLGIKPTAVSKSVQRNRLPAVGNGKKRRFPRATVQDLADRASRGAAAETVGSW